jgi:hypothetical protein
MSLKKFRRVYSGSCFWMLLKINQLTKGKKFLHVREPRSPFVATVFLAAAGSKRVTVLLGISGLSTWLLKPLFSIDKT